VVAVPGQVRLTGATPDLAELVARPHGDGKARESIGKTVVVERLPAREDRRPESRLFEGVTADRLRRVLAS